MGGRISSSTSYNCAEPEKSRVAAVTGGSKPELSPGLMAIGIALKGIITRHLPAGAAAQIKSSFHP
jgi:hypothetical protein